MRFLVAMLAVLALVSVANAEYQVWFQATSGPTPTVQGAPGVTLELPSAGAYTIEAHVSTGALDSPLWGFEAALKGAGTSVGSGLTTAVPPSGQGATSWSVQGSYIGAGAGLFDVAEGSMGTAWNSGNQLVFATFLLTAGAPDQLLAGVPAGPNGWASDEGEVGPIMFGGYSIPLGNPEDVWTSGPAIKILPEPGTLMLLGLGLVGLLRRR